MPTRTGIPIVDCGLSFTDGQKLCADDITAILDFAKASLQRGDTVVSEGPVQSDANAIGAGVDRISQQAARVGFPHRGTGQNTGAQPIAEADFYFENAGQEECLLIANVHPGQGSPLDAAGVYSDLQGRIVITLYDHVGGTKELYNNQTESTPNNVYTLITKSITHGLTLPTPGEGETWRLNVKYELRTNGFADPVNSDDVEYNRPWDGVLSFSLKLFSAC